MRIYRLIEIITRLLNQKTIPAREFAQQFQVSTRTIYRDIEELAAAGLPVYMSKGKGGGISLLDSYTLDKTLVSEQERAHLLISLQALQATQDPDIAPVLEKLKSLFQRSEVPDWVQVEFTPWGSSPNEKNKFAEIKKAIIEQRLIRFAYVDARGEKSQRQVEPLQVIFKSQAWYVWGFCRDRQDFRTFRLSRMKEVELSSERFTRKVEGSPSENVEESTHGNPLIQVKLKFSSEVLYRVYDDFADELIQKNADGSCVVNVVWVADEWVYGTLLSYGCFVEVLEPASLRAAIAGRLTKAIHLYSEMQ